MPNIKKIKISPGDNLTIHFEIGGSPLNWFINWLKPIAYDEARNDKVLLRALSWLPGLTDVEAVKRANAWAKDANLPTITTDEFRKWLPQMLSRFFDETLPKDSTLKN